MSTRSVLLAVLTLALASTACQPPAQEAGPLSEEDVAAIRDFNDLVVEAILANDASALTAVYTEDGVRMAPNEPAQQGRAAIQAAHEASPNVTKLSTTLSEIDGLDGLAYDRGTFSITVRVEGMPEPLTETGKYIWILRKQPDGSWLIAAAIWNSDLPLPEEGSGTEQ